MDYVYEFNIDFNGIGHKNFIEKDCLEYFWYHLRDNYEHPLVAYSVDLTVDTEEKELYSPVKKYNDILSKWLPGVSITVGYPDTLYVRGKIHLMDLCSIVFMLQERSWPDTAREFEMIYGRNGRLLWNYFYTLARMKGIVTDEDIARHAEDISGPLTLMMQFGDRKYWIETLFSGIERDTLLGIYREHEAKGW